MDKNNTAKAGKITVLVAALAAVATVFAEPPHMQQHHRDHRHEEHAERHVHGRHPNNVHAKISAARVERRKRENAYRSPISWYSNTPDPQKTCVTPAAPVQIVPVPTATTAAEQSVAIYNSTVVFNQNTVIQR